MEITKDLVDDIVILRLKGNILSGVDANQIHQMVHEGLEANLRNFILDMQEVSLIATQREKALQFIICPKTRKSHF